MSIKDYKMYGICPYLEENCDSNKCECAKYKAYVKVQDPENIIQKLEELGVGGIEDSWKLLMTMQKSFANKFHKVDNLSKDEMDKWIDKYLVCVEDEVREVREHLNIYPDELIKSSKEEELKKEIIDILHFVMDVFIVGNVNGDDIKSAYLKTFEFGLEPEEVTDLLQFAYTAQDMKFEDSWRKFNDSDINLLTLKLLDTSASVRQQISWKHWKKPSDIIDREKLLDAFARMFKALIDLFVSLDMNPESIKEIYIKKNVENIFRQEFNY